MLAFISHVFSHLSYYSITLQSYYYMCSQVKNTIYCNEVYVEIKLIKVKRETFRYMGWTAIFGLQFVSCSFPESEGWHKLHPVPSRRRWDWFKLLVGVRRHDQGTIFNLLLFWVKWPNSFGPLRSQALNQTCNRVLFYFILIPASLCVVCVCLVNVGHKFRNKFKAELIWMSLWVYWFIFEESYCHNSVIQRD